jgi:bisphosphoglycerate-independent phosphoglycerate mutase (AlkP superfamily)
MASSWLVRHQAVRSSSYSVLSDYSAWPTSSALNSTLETLRFIVWRENKIRKLTKYHDGRLLFDPSLLLIKTRHSITNRIHNERTWWGTPQSNRYSTEKRAHRHNRKKQAIRHMYRPKKQTARQLQLINASYHQTKVKWYIRPTARDTESFLCSVRLAEPTSLPILWPEICCVRLFKGFPIRRMEPVVERHVALGASVGWSYFVKPT